MNPEASRPPAIPAPARALPRDRWLLAAALVALVSITRGYYLADTNTYVLQILDCFGKPPFGPQNRLWEFGHLLWRPLGWVLLECCAPLAGGLTHWQPAAVCAGALIAVNLVTGFAAVLLWHAMLAEFVRSRAAAFFIALAFACGNAFLTYEHSGSPYVPGLFCITWSVWLLRQPSGRTGCLWGAGALAALAALLWFPYVLAAPGIVLLAARGNSREGPSRAAGGSGREGLGRAARLASVMAICLALGFGMGARARGIGTVSQARAWVADSSHGWAQSNRAMRMATGLPRAFFYMGKDGVLYRRYLRRDPYAPVTVADLAGASLWKLAAFYGFLACLWFELLRSAAGRRQAWLLAAGAAPVLAFAVLLFEPGSAERYFPAWPFLIVAVGWALRDFPAARRAPQVALAVVLAAMATANVYAMYGPRIDREDRGAIERLARLKAAGLREGSLVAIVSNQDGIETMCGRSSLDADKWVGLRLYGIVEPGTVQALHWRRSFAGEALAAWSRGGDVWVSKRVWRARPQPEWDWVEGDDRSLSWSALTGFFAPLESSADSGDPDGFLRLDSASDTARLQKAAAAAEE